MNYTEAYFADEGIRWKAMLSEEELLNKIRRAKEQQEWARSELYPRKLLKVESKKKFSIIKMLRNLIP